VTQYVFKGGIVTRHSQEEATSTLDIISHSSAQTQRLGMRLGEILRGGELLLLDGQLGTGKTTFTQGLARGMDITTIVSSPTFTLLKEYRGHPVPVAQPGQDTLPSQLSSQPRAALALYHFDLYRLENPEEIIDLGFEDYFFSSGVCVVEWADKADQLWPDQHLRIHLKMMSETKRGMLFTATGPKYRELLHQFQKNTYATTSS
jgi:tRNA threonylcarbamoyladenosine biosynthesis protein TsaE